MYDFYAVIIYAGFMNQLSGAKNYEYIRVLVSYF